jgi:membrane fusion protein, multidrug efflux system
MVDLADDARLLPPVPDFVPNPAPGTAVAKGRGATRAAVRKDPAAKRRLIKRGALILALLGGAAAAAYFSHEYRTVGRFLESPGDAYVQADDTTIAPKVSGDMADVLVQDNKPVKAGQVLARSDLGDAARHPRRRREGQG